MDQSCNSVQTLQLSQRGSYPRRSQHAHQALVERGFFQYLHAHFRGVMRYSPFLSLEYPEVEADWDLLGLVLGRWREITVDEVGVHVRYWE